MFYSFAYFCYLVLIRHGISGAAFRTVTSQLERSCGRSLGEGGGLSAWSLHDPATPAWVLCRDSCGLVHCQLSVSVF